MGHHDGGRRVPGREIAMTTALAALADHIAVEERILLYAHHLDSLQFERVADEISTEDASLDFGGIHVVSREAINWQLTGYRAALIGCSHNMRT
jgi:hypothetical protein